jgi:nucleoside-diphosphate-sugar epimerase/GT2 family glycosyltransferase
VSGSVIMVSRSSDVTLFAAVVAVLGQQGLAELIVIDNGNTPDIFARLQQMSLANPKLKVLSGGNKGIAAGYNLGVKQATGDFVILLTSDCLLSPNAVEGLTSHLVDTAGAKIAVPLVVHADGSDKDIRRELFAGEANIDNTCLCIRRGDYRVLGGMDENYPVYGYAMDFATRVLNAGGRIVTVTEVRVARMHYRDYVKEKHKIKAMLYYVSKHKSGAIGVLPVMKLMVRMQGFVRRMTSQSANINYKQIRASKRLRVLAGSFTETFEMPQLRRHTVLVTGATSQIGLFVVRRLLTLGAAVLAVSREDSVQFAHQNLRWIKGDLTDEALHLQGYAVDYVIHCAQLWFLPQILPMLAHAGVKRVMGIGSVSRFSRLASKNHHDQKIVRELTKAENDIETFCAQNEMEWTVLRPTLVYGVGADEHISQIAKIIKKHGFFPVYPPAFGRRQPVHADDVALAALQAIVSPNAANKSYNISGAEVMTFHEMLERIFKVLGKPARIVKTTALPFILTVAGVVMRKPFINAEVAHRMNDDLVFFHDDAARDFGYNPRMFLNAGRKDLEG